MSIQSSNVENQTPIWLNPDIGPDTSFVYINQTFNLAEHMEDLKIFINQVDQDNKCKTSIHGQWVKIKGESMNNRRNVFNEINSFSNNSCKEIFLPSVEEISNESPNARLSSPSPPLSTSSISSQSVKKSTAQINSEEMPKRKNGLTRSSTETQISSLQKSKNASSSPFSVLLPLTSNQQNTNTILEHDEYEVDKSEDLNKNQKKHRYSVDFLLLRSDVPNSKKLPSNWKSLNEKFPTVCFCGKVLSYFNPYKYHEHWEKTKNQNYELHDSSYPYHTNNETNFSRAHTDDYLNLQTTLKDLYNNNTHIYNNNYPMNKFRMNNNYNNNNNNEFQKSNFYNNYDSKNNGYKTKNQFSIDNRLTHHTFYQQENHVKRKQKFYLNTQKVFE